MVSKIKSVIAINTPGRITAGSSMLLPISTLSPLGSTPMVGHMSLAGIENGIHQNLSTAQMTATPKLQSKLIKTVKNVPTFSVTNIHSGICQANVTNSNTLAIKLAPTPIVCPNSRPPRVIPIKKTIQVVNKNKVHSII